MRKVEAIDVKIKDKLGYAIFYLDHDRHNIMIESDYGSFSYHQWSKGTNESDDSFYKFLKKINVHYVYDKLSSNNENDIPRNLINEWFEVIKRDRKEWLSKENARIVWDILKETHDECHPNADILINELYSNSELTNIYEEPWYSFEISKTNNALSDFLESYWDKFIAEVDKKIIGMIK